MRGLVQRCSTASVAVDGDVIGRIGHGLCVLVGVTHDDTPAHAAKLASKLSKLRIFHDDDGVMNKSVLDTSGEVLVVSQFTLYANASKGNRPSYVDAARPEHAEPLVEAVVEALRSFGLTVATGRFRAEMQVSLVNEGPTTILLEC